MRLGWDPEIDQIPGAPALVGRQTHRTFTEHQCYWHNGREPGDSRATERGA